MEWMDPLRLSIGEASSSSSAPPIAIAAGRKLEDSWCMVLVLRAFGSGHFGGKVVWREHNNIIWRETHLRWREN